MVTLVFDISDWPRHQEDCIPAMSPTNRYNVNMIATPPVRRQPSALSSLMSRRFYSLRRKVS
jgi:hypothetical protein